tara:strand:- start:429 stop:674 length:246 start_codon:yes stop_codon:yes gene_type:complete
MKKENLPLESEFLLYQIIKEVNSMSPQELANFYVETAFNSRSKLKLSRYGIFGISASDPNQSTEEEENCDGDCEEEEDDET